MNDFVQRFGYAGIALAIGAESMGVPLPGETLLIAASLYAAATGQLDITLIVAAAAIGALIGDNAGYLIGRRYGLPLLVRHGARFGLGERRLVLGRYLFDRHGSKVVFFGRFTALLRTFAALLAGANAMPWRNFLFWNAVGGIAWSSCFGFGAYALGSRILSLAAPIGIAVGAGALVAALVLGLAVRRHGAALEARAVAVMAERDRTRR